MSSFEIISKNKDQLISPDTTDLEELETWESFIARFSRAADIFVSKYLRSRVLFEEPGFRGSLRDMLNVSEKIGLIGSATDWIEIKEIRNLQSHEYTETKLSKFFIMAVDKTPTLLDCKNNI